MRFCSKFDMLFSVLFVACFHGAAAGAGHDTFYVDPTYTGSTTNGAPPTPWTSLTNAGAWAAINNRLASDSVTVYFSARIAAADTAENYDAGIDLGAHKTADHGHPIILNGNSFYNANESTPSWAVYNGPKKCKIRFVSSQNATHTKINDVVIDGFTIQEKVGDGKAVSIAGDHWTVKNCDVSADTGTWTSSDGPLLNIIPTADGAHEGSSSYTPACSNIQILNNIFHDSYGELVYVGGGGCSQNDPTGTTYCNGYPSHDTVKIMGNKFYNGGSRGAQGDGIDVKMGITNLTISGNEFFNLTPGEGNRAIVMQGQTLSGAAQNNIIERNFIHDCSTLEDAAIAVNNSWGTPKGITVRNNIIDNITFSGGGIKIYNGTELSLYNNTIYNTNGYGLLVAAGAVAVENNLIFGCNGTGNQTSMAGTITSDYNAFPAGKWGFAGQDIHSVSLSPGQASGCVVNAAGGNFKLSNASVCKYAAATISDFSNDFTDSNRTIPWDIGAFKFDSIVQTISITSPPVIPNNARCGGQMTIFRSGRNIFIRVPEGGAERIIVAALDGKTVATVRISSSQGLVRFDEAMLRNLRPGIYLAMMTKNGTIQSARPIIVKERLCQ